MTRIPLVGKSLVAALLIGLTAGCQAPMTAEVKGADKPVVSDEKMEPGMSRNGMFVNANKAVSGKAMLVPVGDRTVLKLIDFSSTKGPDLYVYLVKDESGMPKDGNFMSVAMLKSNTGDQEYELPAGTDASMYRSVSIYCKEFSSNFGYAVLK